MMERDLAKMVHMMWSSGPATRRTTNIGILGMSCIKNWGVCAQQETSLDFHPKNSNWSHLENYHARFPSYSPRVTRGEGGRSGSDDDDEGEDFLWSEPPSHPTIDEEDEHADSDAHNQHAGSYTDKSLQARKRHYSRKQSNDNILHFNAGCLPSKLVLVRHGQSEGNVDELLYSTRPDNAMRLTELGWEMARMAGRALREELPRGETVHFIVSPYARTVETFHGIVSAWCDPEGEEFKSVASRSRRLKLWYTRLMEMGLTWHEDPR